MVIWNRPMQTKEDEGGCRWTKVNTDVGRWTKVDEGGSTWTKVDEGERRWTKVNEDGRRVTKVESGWKWMKLSAVLHASSMLLFLFSRLDDDSLLTIITIIIIFIMIIITRSNFHQLGPQQGWQARWQSRISSFWNRSFTRLECSTLLQKPCSIGVYIMECWTLLSKLCSDGSFSLNVEHSRGLSNTFSRLHGHVTSGTSEDDPWVKRDW